MQHRRGAILELLQKHFRRRDLTDLLEQLVTSLQASYTTQEQLTSLMHYMLQVGETRNQGELLSTLASRVPEYEDTRMTIAEKLRLEGEKRGLEKGRLEGWQEGRQEGECDAALQIARAMLACGLERESVMKMTGLTADDLAHIRH
ncbi:hypothetical protein SMTE4_48900 (plasmid) [Serratia marcescens]|nr:hypothetical protein SMTE4_48900 [Serratia marcescens]CAI1908288.1 Putative transposase, YhgA-like [Serratia marcescens]